MAKTKIAPISIPVTVAMPTNGRRPGDVYDLVRARLGFYPTRPGSKGLGGRPWAACNTERAREAKADKDAKWKAALERAIRKARGNKPSRYPYSEAPSILAEVNSILKAENFHKASVRAIARLLRSMD